MEVTEPMAAVPFKATGRQLVSFIIPAGNEGGELVTALSWFIRRCSEALPGTDVEYIIATDTSNLSTQEAMAALSSAKACKSYFLSARVGKGGTIKNMAWLSKGSIIVLLDADVPVSPRDISRAIGMVLDGEADLIIGSRSHRYDGVTRRFLSTAYNSLVRMLFRTGIMDHQAGFKVARAETLIKSLPYIRTDGLGFDTELIVWAKKLKFNIMSITVKWNSRRYSISSNVVPFRALLTMLVDLTLLRLVTLRGGGDLLVRRRVGHISDENGNDIGPEYMTTLNLGDQSIMGLLRRLYAAVAFKN